MQFVCCNVNLDLDLEIHGGFKCEKGHLQCEQCNDKVGGFCVYCGGKTRYTDLRLQWESRGTNGKPSFVETILNVDQEDIQPRRERDEYVVISDDRTSETLNCRIGDGINSTGPVKLQVIMDNGANCGLPGNLSNSFGVHWHYRPVCAGCQNCYCEHCKAEDSPSSEKETINKIISTSSYPCLSAHSAAGQRQNVMRDLPVGELADMKTSQGAISKRSKRPETDAERRELMPKFVDMLPRPPHTRGISKEILRKVSNVYRAKYNPPLQPVGDVWIDPPPQFEIIHCHPILICERLLEKLAHLDSGPVSRRDLWVLASPLECPEAGCTDIAFYSDFAMHISSVHLHVPMEEILTREPRSFFLKPHLATFDSSKLNIVYLVQEKICRLGKGLYENLLPLLLMSRWIKFKDVCAAADDDTEFLMVWVAGFIHHKLKTIVTLNAFSYCGRRPFRHIMQTCHIYDIRASTDSTDIFRSGQLLRLSRRDVDLLTRGDKDIIQMQIMFQ